MIISGFVNIVRFTRIVCLADVVYCARGRSNTLLFNYAKPMSQCSFVCMSYLRRIPGVPGFPVCRLMGAAVMPAHGVKKMERRNSYGGSRQYNDAPREMTKAICSDCGKECEVPFKPTEGRPVYCRDCLPKHRAPRSPRY